jgi:hypothetical protein
MPEEKWSSRWIRTANPNNALQLTAGSLRDGGMLLLSVIRVTPGQAEASDVNETHYYRSKKEEKNEDNEQAHRNER